MKPKNPDWYKKGWSLDIKNQSWVEDTADQVSFIEKTLGLTGAERILDLACGFGRHSLEFARRGYPVIGIDLTADYIEDAIQSAKEQSLPAQFLCLDIRNLPFEDEFDVVLNLADGAIGYLEDDDENLKIFDVIARSLKHGGKHFMDVCNAEHAECYFPRLNWEIGDKALALAQFDWDAKTRRMLYGGCDIPYGLPATKPEIPLGDPIRLYSRDELEAIFGKRGMQIVDAFSNYGGKPASYKELQLLVYSTKP